MFVILEALKRAVWVESKPKFFGILRLLGCGVLGDGLGALTDSVLGELTRQQQSDGGLDLPRGDGAPLVVVSQTASLGGDSLKDVVHERVHDGHGL